MKSHYCLLLAAALALPGCVTSKFSAYEGRNSVVQGQGGTKTLVDGMEVWEDGDPPRKFQILGLIKDERPAGGIAMMLLKRDMVKQAKAAGGQAIVLIRSQSQVTGYMTDGQATASTRDGLSNIYASTDTTVVRRNAATFAVVKYLD